MGEDIFWMVTVAILASLLTPAMLLGLVIYSYTKGNRGE